MSDAFSKDIGNLVPIDMIGDDVYVKRKLAFGVDGEAFDVSALNPLPITGTITVVPGGQGFSNFAQGTPKLVTLPAGVSTVLLTQNTNRKFARIVNIQISRVYLQYGNDDAVYGVGIPLDTNASETITSDELFQGQISGISLTDTQVWVVEGVI